MYNILIDNNVSKYILNIGIMINLTFKYERTLNYRRRKSNVNSIIII